VAGLWFRLSPAADRRWDEMLRHAAGSRRTAGDAEASARGSAAALREGNADFEAAGALIQATRDPDRVHGG